VWATTGAVAQNIYSSVLDVEDLDPDLHLLLSVAARRMDRVQPDKKERVSVARAEQYMKLAGEAPSDEDDGSEEEGDAGSGPDPK
jgi:hypothetical protein